MWDNTQCVITVCIFLLMDVAFRDGEVMDLATILRLWHSRNNWLIDCLIKGPKQSLPGKQSPHTLQSVCRWQVLRWASALLVEIFHLLGKVTFSSLYLSCLSKRVPTAASTGWRFWIVRCFFVHYSYKEQVTGCLCFFDTFTQLFSFSHLSEQNLEAVMVKNTLRPPVSKQLITFRYCQTS